MKKTIILFICILLLNCGTANSKEEFKYNHPQENSISVYCTQDLYKLTTKLASEYCSLNPYMNIEVINVSESTIAKTENVGRNLRFISNDLYPSLNDEPLWKTVIGRDVVVPIINSKNPFMDEIYQQGISPEEFARIFENPEMQQWEMLLMSEQNAPVNYYMINDKSINSGVANFLNLNIITIDGITVDNENELISSIQKDPYALGFCKLINIVDFSNQSIDEDIKLLPIDRNGNGEIDYVENIYDDLNVFLRGVWIGKYPKALIDNIYAISPIKPTDETEVAFLKWVLTDGQQYLNSTGYFNLAYSERQRKLDVLLYDEIITSTTKDDYAISNIVLIILVAFVFTVFIVNVVVRYTKRKKSTVKSATSIYPLVFDENSVKVPKGLYFDKTHTWAFMEINGIVRIGIDDFLQHITGPITRIKMKVSGEKIKKGEQILSIIHKGKQLHINAPISGTIKAQNKTLIPNSSIMNSSPYSDGWVYKIEPTNWLREIQFLIMEKKYKEWLRSEFSRLKDFLAVSAKPKTVEFAPSVLQDGGEIKDGVLADFGPEVWEDFQTNFIDTSN